MSESFWIDFYFFYYLYQYNEPNFHTVPTTVFVWFVLPEFKWLWLVAGNRCFQCDGVREVGVLDEDGSLTIWSGVGDYIKCRERGWISKGVGALRGD